MSATIVKNAHTDLAKQNRITQEAEMSQSNIVKKTIQMSETMKKYPRPSRK